MGKISISLDIDETELKKLLDTRVSERSKEEIRSRLGLMFCSPYRQPEHDHLARYHKGDPDLSVGWKMIRDKIDEKLLGEKFQAFMDTYIEENFERILTDTLNKAMQHQANKMAFGPDARGKMKVTK